MTMHNGFKVRRSRHCEIVAGALAMVWAAAAPVAANAGKVVAIPLPQKIPNLHITRGEELSVCKDYKTAFERTLLNPKSWSLEPELAAHGFSLPTDSAVPVIGVVGLTVLRPFGGDGGYIVVAGASAGWFGMDTTVKYFPASAHLEDRIAAAIAGATEKVYWADIERSNPDLAKADPLAHHEGPTDVLINIIWRHNQDIYVLEPTSEALHERELQLRRLASDGSLHTTCTIAFRSSRRYRAFQDAYGEHDRAYWAVAGDFARCMGSLGAGRSRPQSTVGNFKLLELNSPWRILDRTDMPPGFGRVAHTGIPMEIARLLALHSGGSIFDFEATQRFLESVPPVERSLADYFRRDLGLRAAEASSLAAGVAHQIAIDRFVISSDFQPADPEFDQMLIRFRLSHDEREEDALYENLRTRLAGRSDPEFKNDDTPDVADLRFALVEALVPKPRLLGRYLEDKGNPNAANWYYKTLLMSAAHHNQPQSVKLLLSHGADSESWTDSSSDSCNRLARDQRNALMYAAENADSDVVRTIAQSTKNFCHMDTKRNFAAAYLMANQRLKMGERRRIYQNWMERISACPHFRKPSYNCADADNVVDMVTCTSSEVGSESMLADAYARLRGMLSGAELESLIRAQKDWVWGKQTACLGRYEHYGELDQCVGSYYSNRQLQLWAQLAALRNR